MFACYRLARFFSICFFLVTIVPAMARSEVITYQYDEANRVISTSFDGSTAVHNVYDPLGNRLAKTTVTGDVDNSAPLSPGSPAPGDGAVDIDPQVQLTWTGGDSDADDQLFYTIFFGEQAPAPLTRGGLAQPQYQQAALKSYTTYYWSVSVKDNFNNEAAGPVWSFTTGNTPPAAPALLQPGNGTAIDYLNLMLTWQSVGDPNPNDSVVYDVYLGTTSSPPMVAEGLVAAQYPPGAIKPDDTYYWKIAARDNNGATVSSPVFSFSFVDTDQDGLPDDLEAAGCTDPYSYDSDMDSIPDGVEDANLNGVVDATESSPCSGDTDGDGMSDQWEIAYGLDPLNNDGTLDGDGDGITNIQEYLNGTDPHVADAGQTGMSIEGFESGDFSKFYWLRGGPKLWTVSDLQPFEGGFSAQSPQLAIGESANLQTWVLCDEGTISFFSGGRTMAGGGWLRFYIDGELQGEWSGDKSYEKISFPVSAGVHHFSWAYIRENGDADFGERIFLDRIAFPGLPDDDGDGVHDGWELQHFGTLAQTLCVDNDGDGLSDLEEAAIWSSPHLIDTDGDSMPDSYEAANNLDTTFNDALVDADGDGDVNISEYYGGTSAADKGEYGFAAMENFETGDLQKFYWTQGGSGFWSVSPQSPYRGVYGAQPELAEGGSAELTTTVNGLSGLVAFQVKFLSEDDTGLLQFFIDGVLRQAWTANQDYTLVSFPVDEGVHTYTWVYLDSRMTDAANGAWVDDIIFPGKADSDGDGAIDAWELEFFGALNQALCQDSDGDAISDLREAAALSNPLTGDSDGDSMADGWEIAHSLDPLRDDASGDSDGDGYSNLAEYLGQGDPGDPDSQASSFEGFENGDLRKFHWVQVEEAKWTVSSNNGQAGTFAAEASSVADGQSASLSTTVLSLGAPVSFYVATSSQASADHLQFYINGQLMGEWSGETPYQEVSFAVLPGRTGFTWIYTKDGTIGEGQDAVWLDSITFPGPADSDSDGVIDGWEFHYFDTLDAPLCGDSDGDGILDLIEASAGSDPHLVDTDGDGMADGWEISNGLDPRRDDASEDSDGDGFTNLAEFTGQGDPNDGDFEVGSFEGFESGDLTKFHWLRGGDENWWVSAYYAQAGRYTAQTPNLSDAQSASLTTTVLSQGGPVSFYISTSSQEAADVVSFYINDQLMGEWSGEAAYEKAIFDVTAGRTSFTWTYSKDGAAAEGQDTIWLDSITFPGPADSDGDGISDGWEFLHFDSLNASLCGDSDGDGVTDIDEALAGTSPHSIDTDGDGIDDLWEILNALDPLLNDAYSDRDGDGFSNLAEYLGQGNPNGEEQEVGSFEGFETGDFTRFHWLQSGDGNWQVDAAYAQDGDFAAVSPQLIDSQASSLTTTIESRGGPITFYVATSTQEGADVVSFYIDNQLMGEWSGDTPYQLVSFDVQPGRTSFTWTYSKDGATAEGQDVVWLDSITFPGPADSDGDGVIDGWEYDHFDSLAAAFCADSDGDGLSDVEEALAGTDPFSVDSDGDGMNDAWEIANGLDPKQDDGLADPDGDGVANYYEYIGGSDPNTMNESLATTFEGFESGDFSKFGWVVSGDDQWQVEKSKPWAGNFSALTADLADGQSSTLETTLNCEAGPLSFHVATGSQANADILEFAINGVVLGQWSGATPYQLVSFDVAAGKNTFTWTYTKDDSTSQYEDTVWLDNISFPGKADSDGDGILDGWEYHHFNSLDHTVCADSDGDGLIDLEELINGTDPLNPDTDGDGVPDRGAVAAATQSMELAVTELSADEYADQTTELPPANYIILEDAEDALLEGWDIFDSDPSGAFIDIVFDTDRNSLVLDFYSSGIDNGFRFRNADGTWLENSHNVLQWDIRSAGHFVIYAAVQTDGGVRYLQYEPVDEDYLGDGEIIEHGLGQFVDDDSWHTIVRDLAYDLREAQPANSLQSFLGFLVRGSCQIDDVITRQELPADQDSDQDGLTDVEEINTIGTHPYYGDSDGDGMGDGDEYIFWGDAWNDDPDNDGLINILDADSDNDAILDGDEVN